MKKLLQKDKKDKEEKKKDKEEKKKDKEEKKKEKKEKKDKSKKSKKDKHSASTSSLEQVPEGSNFTSQSTTVVTETAIDPDSSGGATKTILVKETVKERSGERVSETNTEEKITGDLSGENVIKTSTTTTITESETDQPIETKTVVKETTKTTPQGVEKVVVTKKSFEVQSGPTTSITESETDQPIETKTVVKETTNTTPQGVEKVVVTKKSFEVQSGPTTSITESETDQPIETKTVVKETTNTTPQGVEKVVVTKKSFEVQSGPTTSITESETDQPIETKTVVKETTNTTPQGVEKIVVTNKLSEVQSVPSTREFLTENFPEVAGFETMRQQPSDVQDSTPTVQPTHVSERTVVREMTNGGNTVKTVTKVVSDEEGKRETTTTTTLGKNKEIEDAQVDSSPKRHKDEGEMSIISDDIERKAEFPEWLNNVPNTSTPKGQIKIDDSIDIPFNPLQTKEPLENLKPTGPKVIEEILPIEDFKENVLNDLENLENAERPTAKESKPKPPEDIPFTYEPKQSEKKVYTGVPVTEKVDDVKLVNKTETAEIDFASLQKREEPKNPAARTVQQTHTRKVISTNGDTVETVTKTITDEEGRVKKTETKTISEQDQKPKQSHDVNDNMIESNKPKTSPKISKRNLHEGATKNAKNIIEDDEDGDDREILEEIIVIEKKRKVRIPKSFVPYEKERPRAVLPIDMLIERQSRPRKLPPVGKRVEETVEEHTQNRKSEIPDLDELDRLLTAI